MGMPADGEQLLARIGFAERWLGRARAQCAEGNVARSVLTLVLADAEVHHALEAVGMPVRSRPRRAGSVALVLAAAALASGLLLAGRRPTDAGPAVATPAPPVVRLASSSGALLEAFLPSVAVPAPPSHRSGSPAPSATAGPVGALRVAPVLAPPLEAPRAAGSSGVAGGTPTVSSGPAHISTPDLIDLMLTAERVMRQGPASPSTP